MNILWENSLKWKHIKYVKRSYFIQIFLQQLLAEKNNNIENENKDKIEWDVLLKKWTNPILNKKRAVDREKKEIVISLLSLSNAHDVPWSAHCNLQSYVLHRRCKYTCTHVYIASQTPNNCFVNRPAMSSVAIIRAPDYSSFRLLSTVSNNYCVRLFMNAVANVFILIISFSCSRL